jgi:predicted  nucleic acid-binding Zn-ribbon protein
MAMLPKRAEYADFLVNQQGMSQAEARRMAEQQYPVRSQEDEIRGLRANLQSINERLSQEPPPRVGNAAFGITPPVSPLEQQRRELSDQLARLEGRHTTQEAAALRAQQQQAQQAAEAARAERRRQAELESRGITKEMQAKYTPQQIENIFRTGNSNAAILVPDPQKPARSITLRPGQPGYTQAVAGDMRGAWNASAPLRIK